MRADDDDIIGSVPDEETDEPISLRTSDVHSVLGGVSVPWLMKAFRMGRQTIERKLVGCRPIGQGKHGTPLYDLPEAASYIVRPRLDMEQYLKGLKPYFSAASGTVRRSGGRIASAVECWRNLCGRRGGYRPFCTPT